MKVPLISAWLERRAERRSERILAQERAQAEWQESMRIARELGTKAARERHPAGSKRKKADHVEPKDLARLHAGADSFMLEAFYRTNRKRSCRR